SDEAPAAHNEEHAQQESKSRVPLLRAPGRVHVRITSAEPYHRRDRLNQNRQGIGSDPDSNDRDCNLLGTIDAWRVVPNLPEQFPGDPPSPKNQPATDRTG